MADLSSTNTGSTLKKTKHQWDECRVIAPRASYLKRHKESLHEGIRNPCDECEYAATKLNDLKRQRI